MKWSLGVSGTEEQRGIIPLIDHARRNQFPRISIELSIAEFRCKCKCNCNVYIYNFNMASTLLICQWICRVRSFNTAARLNVSARILNLQNEQPSVGLSEPATVRTQVHGMSALTNVANLEKMESDERIDSSSSPASSIYTLPLSEKVKYLCLQR